MIPALFPVRGPASVTWDPSSVITPGSWVFSNGNNTAEGLAGGSAKVVLATLGRSTGKWYFELVVNIIASSSTGPAFGAVNTVNDLGLFSTGTYYDTSSGFIWLGDGGSGQNNTGVISSNGDRISVAVDIGAGKVWFAHNGTWLLSGNPAAGTNQANTIALTGTLYPAMRVGNDLQEGTLYCSSGSFVYSIPTGFSAWQS